MEFWGSKDCTMQLAVVLVNIQWLQWNWSVATITTVITATTAVAECKTAAICMVAKVSVTSVDIRCGVKQANDGNGSN